MKRSTSQLIRGLCIRHADLHQDIPFFRNVVAKIMWSYRESRDAPQSSYRLFIAWRIYKGFLDLHPPHSDMTGGA